MSTFPLKILTPEGNPYHDEARQLTVRTTEGYLTILPRHINCVAPLAIGTAAVTDANGLRRSGSCSGGFLAVMDGSVCIITSGFRWHPNE